MISLTSPRTYSLRFSRSRVTLRIVLFVFATALAPFVLPDQRNLLVIAVSGASLPLLLIFRLRVGRELLLPAFVLLYLLIAVLIFDGPDQLDSVWYTGLFVSAFFGVVGALNANKVSREEVCSILRALIYCFALVSVLQMTCSILGIPVINEISSKGIWSYNSLGTEPSHASRALAVTFLAYLLLSRKKIGPASMREVWRDHRLVACAFLVSILLTGSALGIAALGLTLLLSLRFSWALLVCVVATMLWSFISGLQIDSLQRLLRFLGAIPSLDIDALVEADQSGAVRLMPLFIYLKHVDIFSLEAWFGGGFEGIANYVQGYLIGVRSDIAMAGFLPGYLMVAGIVGAALFGYTFHLRYLTRNTFRFGLLWAMLFASSAWNAQLFWYGLMLLRVVYHYDLGARVRRAEIASDR